MSTPADWIREHQIIAFFLLSISLMFVLLPLAIYIMPTDNALGQLGQMCSASFAVFSPVLAAIIIYRITSPKPRGGKSQRRWIAFLVSWVVATTAAYLNMKVIGRVPVPWYSLVVFGGLQALIPAYVISYAFSSITKLRDFLSSLIRPKGSLAWYFIAFLTFPICHLIGALATSVVEESPFSTENVVMGDILLSFGITFLHVFFFAGGVNEESGWRGFAMKHLQARFSPLVACLILWLLMVIWHIPNDLTQYAHGNYLQVRFLLYPFITILFSWVYNRTKGSILAAVIFHASMNSMNPLMGILPFTTIGNGLLICFAIYAVIHDKMWLKLSPDHPAVRQNDNLQSVASISKTASNE
jgi:membrane protease YdiL (CAAX protease family)